jgi:ankyrin repeat protein
MRMYACMRSKTQTDPNRLVLTNVISFLGMAVEEIEALSKEVSESGGGAYDTMERYRERKKVCLEIYSQVHRDISRAIADFPHPAIEACNLVSRDAFSKDPLSFDIFAVSPEEIEHRGGCCALDDMINLDTECLLELVPSPQSVSQFIQCRKEFLKQCVTISNKYKFKSSHTCSILRSQLFLPKMLLQIPEILNEVRNDKRRDCLGRSAWCMGHDAGLRTQWPETNLGDVDVIGRSVWYLACASNDSALLDQLLSRHPTPWRIQGSSLYPSRLIHAAASKGYTAIFQSLRMAFPDDFRARIGAIVDERDLNCLHVAAKAGNRSTVEYLCQHLPAQFVNRRKCTDDRTALHLAAMGGRVEVMDCLIEASRKDRFSDARDSDYRSAFWWAAWNGSVEALRLLKTQWTRHSTAGVDDRDVHGNTPFAISIINSNFDAARYLLSLNTSKKVRVDVNRDNMASQTPLDHANNEWDARGCFDDEKELDEDDKELETFIAFLKTHGALTYDEMQEQEMWSDGEEEEDSEGEYDQEEDEELREDEPIDMGSEDLMDVKFDFDSYFAQVSMLNISH